MRYLFFSSFALLLVLISGCSLPSLPTLPGIGSLMGATPSGQSTGARSAQPRAVADYASPVQSASQSITSPSPTSERPNPQPGILPAPGVGPFYQRSYALVIGMDDYAQLPKLRTAVADSSLVSAALRAHGFSVTHKKNLNSAELRDTLEEFFYQTGADKEAGLLLWFAGHGHNIGSEGYLLPIDTPKFNGSDVEFRRKAYPMRNFGTLMREARARHILAVFDSCFAGTIFKNTRAALPPAIDQANKFPVRQFISAGDHTQEVNDDGAFQRAFLAAITGEDATADSDRNGYVTGEELGIFIKNRILAASNGTQTPQFGKLAENDFERGDFIFRVGTGSATAVAPALPNQPPRVQIAGSRDPLAHMTSTKVYLAAIYGAPGSGNAELRQALNDQLLHKGFQVVDYDTEFAFKIHGTVQKRTAGALVDELTIKWLVFGVNREPLGLVEERLEIFSGARDGKWGTAADKSAAFAAERLPKYLARPS